MIQYLIIQLDDTSVSFCHYPNPRTRRRLIPLDTLKAGVMFGMKENLNIQFVYPDYPLPEEYMEVIDSIDHTDIKPCSQSYGGDVVVLDSLDEARGFSFRQGVAYVVRTDKRSLFEGVDKIEAVVAEVDRLNVVITDVETFTDEDFDAYKAMLHTLCVKLEMLYMAGKTPQLNLLTDRMMLDKMNNCGAGETTLSLMPDGCFYVCPAFYLDDGGYAVGSLQQGPDLRNPQLYRLDHAPLCRRCDAYQCRRCIWLNRKTTLEVNTPGHEQCVVSHLERNAARDLLTAIRKHGTFLPDKEEIKEIEYLDPFDVRNL